MAIFQLIMQGGKFENVIVWCFFEKSLSDIQANIDRYGHHIYCVSGNNPCPRYDYTIGLYGTNDFELVFAGGSFYQFENVIKIINKIANEISNYGVMQKISVHEIGDFYLKSVHESWVKLLMYGAHDYYQKDNIQAFQIIPEPKYFTKDIPDLSLEFNIDKEPVWKWLIKPWEYIVPSDSIAVTNIDVLKGDKVTEVCRWEEDNWEMFSKCGQDILEMDIRPVTLGTLIALDPSLEVVVGLEVGKGLWRDHEELIWHKWN